MDPQGVVYASFGPMYSNRVRRPLGILFTGLGAAESDTHWKRAQRICRTILASLQQQNNMKAPLVMHVSEYGSWEVANSVFMDKLSSSRAVVEQELTVMFSSGPSSRGERKRRHPSHNKEADEKTVKQTSCSLWQVSNSA